MFYLDYFITLYLWILICALMWKVFLHYLFFKREVSQAGRCFIYFKLIVSFFLHLLLITSSPLYVYISSYAFHALLSNLKMEHPCIQGYTMHISLKTKHTWTNLIFLPKQSSLYSIPGISVVFIHIHSEEYSQATSQAARLLF